MFMTYNCLCPDALTGEQCEQGMCVLQCILENLVKTHVTIMIMITIIKIFEQDNNGGDDDDDGNDNDNKKDDDDDDENDDIGDNES